MVIFTGRNVAIARFGFEPKRGTKNEDSDDSDSDSDNDSENSTNRLKGKLPSIWINYIVSFSLSRGRTLRKESLFLFEIGILHP